MSGRVSQKVLSAVFSHGHSPNKAKRFRSLRTLLRDLLNCPAFCNQAWYGCVGILFIWNHTKLSTTKVSMLVHKEFLAEHLSMFFPVSQTFNPAIVLYYREDWWNSLWLKSKSGDQVTISSSIKVHPCIFRRFCLKSLHLSLCCYALACGADPLGFACRISFLCTTG